MVVLSIRSSYIPAQRFRHIARSVALEDDCAADRHRPRLLIIWAMGALMVLGQFNHVVNSEAGTFGAVSRRAPPAA